MFFQSVSRTRTRTTTYKHLDRDACGDNTVHNKTLKNHERRIES